MAPLNAFYESEKSMNNQEELTSTNLSLILITRPVRYFDNIIKIRLRTRIRFELSTRSKEKIHKCVQPVVIRSR